MSNQMAMGTEGRSRANIQLRAYVALLAAALAAILVAQGIGEVRGDLWWWAYFVALYLAAEHVLLFFHHSRGRVGLSVSEAIFLPMLFALSSQEIVWAITVATLLSNMMQIRLGVMKAIFNVAQFGIAAAASAFLYPTVASGATGFTPRSAIAAVLATFLFALLTHVFVAGAISFAEQGSFLSLSRGIATETILNLAGNIIIGLLFAAAYAGARWSAFMFPLPLAALFFGYRAVLRQLGERDRIQKLHDATRALVASPDLDHAVVGFLAAAEDIVSATEARVVISGSDGHRWTAVRDGEAVAIMEPVDGTPLVDLMLELRRAGGSLVIGQDQEGPRKWLLERLGVRSLVAAELSDVGGGCLLAIDRIGADEFGGSDAKMLHALAQELVLSLDSHRLFSQIAEERERFLRIFAGSREGICLLDRVGKVVAWNPALEEITGYPPQEIVGSVLADRVMFRTADERRLGTEEVVAAQADEVLEVVTRAGPPRWVALMSGPVSSGREGGHVILVRDVTKEHAFEEAKSDFLSTISHELRTPLTAIKGSLQILERGPDEVSDDIRGQMVGVMQRGADRLERLVLNLLFVSQIELDGAPRVIPDEIDLEELVRARIPPLVPEHVTAEVVADTDEPIVVRADREKLAQVIEHLTDNAVKFGAGSPIEIVLTKDNGFAQLAVHDGGPGIPESDQARIFERFVRLGPSLRRETQGAGVGLFIVKESVTAMGGRVTVESEAGRGTTFRVTIPLARPMAVPATG